MLEKIKNWLLYDPKAKQKIAFIAVATVVVGLVIFLLLYLNAMVSQPQTGQNPDEIPVVQTESREPVIAFDFKGEEFENLIEKPIGLPTQLYFVNNSEEIYYFDEELQLSSNKRQIPAHTRIIPQSLQHTIDGLIINERDESSLFLETSNNFVRFGQNAISVNFFEQEYYFLNKSQNRVVLKKSINALLQRPETVVQFSPQIDDFETLELRNLNNQLYVFVYQQRNREGDLEIWQINNRSTRKIQTLDNIVSLNFDENRFLYTMFLEGEYSTSLLDFSKNPAGEIVNLNMRNGLAERGLEGVIVAHRCVFEDKAENLYCPVKIEKVPSSDPRFADKAILFNYRSQAVFAPYPEFESPVSNLHLDQQKNLYFISQIDGKLYLIQK